MIDSDILKELLIQNLNIQEDRKEEERSPEITDLLVLPPEAVVTPKMETTKKMEEMEWESIIEEKDAKGLTDQELKFQKDEEEFSIYIAGIGEEGESRHRDRFRRIPMLLLVID